ncbi:MAG: electron transport complex subunit RsxC [Candidatus Sumerlaeia bacterium]
MSLISDISKGIKTFKRGGVHPDEAKQITEECVIEILAAPDIVYIPLSQHIGAPCEPLVKRGDEVKVGQMIGKADAFVSAPIHSSVSGKVQKIDLHPHPLGSRGQTVIIQNDGEETWDESINLDAELPVLDKKKGKEYLGKIRDAGLVGLGGAAFPTHVKLSPPEDKKIEVFLVNGAECEPYLTADYRVMLERSRDVLFGARIIMIVLGVDQAAIAIEDNKPKAIEAMREAIAKENSAMRKIGDIGVTVCKTKYPQGGEKQLINAVLGRVVPSGKLPMDVGVVVANIGTCLASMEAVTYNKPLIERVVTVAGTGIPNPRNLLTRVGTPFEALLKACGYDSPPEGSKLIMGGPMMGKAQRDTIVPVVKGTSGLVVLTPEEVEHFGQRPCLRCGRCVEVCPMGLMPSRLGNFAENDVLEPLKDLGIMDCIECGSCAYICPSQRHLVQWIRMGKMKLREKDK